MGSAEEVCCIPPVTTPPPKWRRGGRRNQCFDISTILNWKWYNNAI